MTENNNSFVSPDKLSQPRQAELGIAAGERLNVDYRGTWNAKASLRVQLESSLGAVSTMQPVDQRMYEQSAISPSPTPPAYQSMPGYQIPTDSSSSQSSAPTSRYYGGGVSMDSYMGQNPHSPQPSDFQQTEYPVWTDPVMDADAEVRAETARQDAENARQDINDGKQDNYRLAA